MHRIAQRRRVWIPLLSCALALALTATALAAGELTQKAGTAGCVSETGTGGTCQDGRGLGGATASAVSPDGEYAYVASSGGDGIAILNRAPATGGLGQTAGTAGCFSVSGNVGECQVGRKLDQARDVAVSPNGKSVYVAAPGDDAIAVFGRSVATGELTQLVGADGCVIPTEFEGCDIARGLQGASAVAVSPDEAQVYVASASGAIAIFDRESTGALAQKAGAAGCINEGGAESCTDGNAQMLGASDLVISPDGKAVYMVAPDRNAVTVYDRNLATGELAQKAGAAGCVNEGGSSGCQSGKALLGAASVAISSDGASVYVGSRQGDAIAVFDRSATTNELTQKAGTAGCVSETGHSDPSAPATAGACQDGVALDEVTSVAVLPGDGSVYVTARESDALAIFARVPNGALAQESGAAGCLAAFGASGCQVGRGLLGASGVAVAANGENVYATATDSSAISVFDVTAAPPEPPEEPPVVTPPPAPPVVAPSQAPAAAVVPRVYKGKGPKPVVRTRSAKATVRFAFSSDQAGAGFRCKLDKGGFKACRSPVTLQTKPGRHSFVVQAVLADRLSAPATFGFTVKRQAARR